MAEPHKPPSRKQRDCPALGRAITSADCGSRRGSSLACPITCPHYPLGVVAPELWTRLNNEWSRKALERVAQHVSRDAFPALARQHALPVGDENSRLNSALHQVVAAKLFVERDAAGRAGGDGWEDEPLAGLNNDERTMTRHRRHGRVTVIEVQRLVDGSSFEALDLLDPGRPAFLVFDPTTAERAVRFTRLLTWLTHYPGVSRVTLPAFEVPHQVFAEWDARVRAAFQEAAAAMPALNFKDFLSLQFGRCATLVQTVVTEHAERLMARTDMHRCLVAYRLQAPVAEVEAVLRALPEFRLEEPRHEEGAPETQARFSWLRLGESAALEPELEGLVHLDGAVDGVRTVGSVRLYEGRLVIGTLAKVKHAFARRMIERYLGEKIAFDQEVVEDLTQAMDAQGRGAATVSAAEQVLFDADDQLPEPVPASASPEGGVESPDPARREGFREEHLRHYQGFLDQPLDVLEGKTPRAAAADPSMRTRLTEVMKSHLHGIARRNRDEGLQLEIHGILDALNLGELK